MSRTKYEHKDFNAHEKLAKVLGEAGIEQGIDENLLPGLHAAAQRQPSDRRTGPVIACRIRNMIVHPTDHEDELYRRDKKLVQQAWLLTQHYLVRPWPAPHRTGRLGERCRTDAMGDIARDPARRGIGSLRLSRAAGLAPPSPRRCTSR